MDWEEVKDGPLLDKVQKAGFDVMVTGDKNIYSQQNLKGRKLAIVALGTNNWNVVKENLSSIIEAVNQAKPRTYKQLVVEHTTL